MDFLIVTGLSGAGKSGVSRVLEDIGYYCVDNSPPTLIERFSEICMKGHGRLDKVALVVDCRGGEMFKTLFESLSRLKSQGHEDKILCLDCSDQVVMTRYKETRRKHPLCGGESRSLLEAIQLERRLLEEAKQKADYVIDTTFLTPGQLREKVCTMFLGDGSERMLVSCMSFGFKYGLPSEADLVFDVRCLPNPYYIPELKHHTGREKPVEDYVLQWESSKQLLDKLCDLLEFWMPLYVKEGKSQLIIAIGCTGGKHRSVVFAEHITAFLLSLGYRAACIHRDIEKAKS